MELYEIRQGLTASVTKLKPVSYTHLLWSFIMERQPASTRRRANNRDYRESADSHERVGLLMSDFFLFA